MAIPTLLIGFLPNYRSIGVAAPLLLLLAMRVMQGIAIGGEAPGAWVFVAEHARRGQAGFAVGLLTGGLSCGIRAPAESKRRTIAPPIPRDPPVTSARLPFSSFGSFMKGKSFVISVVD